MPAGTSAATSKDSERRSNVRRVALVVSQLRPGGMERVVVHLAGHLSARGVEPLVICLQEKGELAPKLEARGVRVIALRSLQGYDVTAVFRLARFLVRFRPCVINVHDYSSLPYVAIASLVIPRCPVVFTAHGLLYEGFRPLQRRYRFFSHRVSTVAAVSAQVRDRHVDFLNWHGTTHIVPNGVPDIRRRLEDRREIREELGIGDREFVFLAVGNPRPEKGFEDLISAAVKVQHEAADRSFSVLIVGGLSDSEYCVRLRGLAEASGLEGLRLLGYRADVKRLYSAADAFIISSRSEGLPMVLLEAMTAGLPVIATRVGGIPDALPDNCGLLVEPGQPSQLAGGMLQLLKGGENLCELMGRAARARAIRKFGVGRMVERYLEVYLEHVRNGGRHGQL